MYEGKKSNYPSSMTGTRFLYATESQPYRKRCYPLLINQLFSILWRGSVSRIEGIIIVTGKGKRAIEDHFVIRLCQKIICAKRVNLSCQKRFRNHLRRRCIIYGKRNLMEQAIRIWCARKFIGMSLLWFYNVMILLQLKLQFEADYVQYNRVQVLCHWCVKCARG